MKKLQLLLLLGVGAAVAVVVSDYFDTQQANLRVRIAEPDKIASNLNSQADAWRWSQSSGNHRSIEISAGAVQQGSDSLILELRDVVLRIPHESSRTFDRIETKQALFNGETEELYSDGEVLITLGVPVDDGEDGDSPTKVRSSGMTFKSKTSTCSSNRYTEYEFDGGRGHSVGAFYDSTHRLFRMNSDVHLERFAARPGGPALKIRAGELLFYEDAQRINLNGGTSLERGSERLEAASAEVYLDDGLVRHVNALEASLRREQPERQVRFASKRLEVALTPMQTTERVTGTGAARLKSETKSSDLIVEGERIELHYVTPPGADEALLENAHAREGARIEVLSRGSEDSHGLRRVEAEWIQLEMGENGEEIRTLATVSRGRMDLLPENPDEPKRKLVADRLRADYAPRNRMERLIATGKVELESIPPRDVPTLRTWSDALEAHLDPGTGELQTLKQWGDFRFERGGRTGQSGEAEFRLVEHRIDLRNDAIVHDGAGRISAWRIGLNEEDGSYDAEGGVSSMFHEGNTSAAEGDSSGSFFSPSKPVFATAGRMVSNSESGLLEYRGEARLWQGSDRIEGEQIRIERKRKTLSATGNVVSWLEGHGADGKPGKAPPPIRISAQSMDYSEAENLVVYQDGVELLRGQLRVQSDRLEARLRAEDEAKGSESSGNKLDQVVATGNVTISETVEGNGHGRGGRGRSGRGEEGEYYPNTEQVKLRGGPARVTDATGSVTTGAELTYQVNDDRLLVLGRADDRAYTLRRRKQ